MPSILSTLLGYGASAGMQAHENNYIMLGPGIQNCHTLESLIFTADVVDAVPIYRKLTNIEPAGT